MLQVNVCGYGSNHAPNTRITSISGSKDYLLLLIGVNASIIVNNQTYNTNPNTLIIFDKNTPYNYGSVGDIYHDDWIHFDCYDEVIDFEKMGLTLNMPIMLPEISTFTAIITLLVNEYYQKGPHYQLNTESYLRILLNKLSEYSLLQPNSTQTHPHYPAMNQLRISIQNMPYKKWTIDQMASELNLSPSRFQHLYKSLFNISCINDVIGARIEYARYHLKTTDLSIQEIAQICGYENDVHFIRQFKKLTGMPPGEFRKQIPVDVSGQSRHKF